MSDHDERPGRDADVIPIRANDVVTEARVGQSGPGEPQPVYADLTDVTDRRKPVIPHHWQTRDRAREHLRLLAARYRHWTLYHGVRTPSYLVKATGWSLWGIIRTIGQLLEWWHVPDHRLLESQAAADGLIGEYLRLHGSGKKTRHARGLILAFCLAVAVILVLAAVTYAPSWWWIPVAVTAVPFLARAGRPEHQPIIQAAILPDTVQPPTREIITRALGALGIPGINKWLKDNNELDFPEPIREDGPGWKADVNLPYGVTAGMVIERRDQLSSGLRRPLGAVWPEPVTHEHAGRLELWVGRADAAKARPQPGPLLRGGEVNVFELVPFGTDVRGRLVKVPLIFHNWLIGAIPRQGKALALDTPVPTPGGWTTMGELRAGDEVFDEQGRPCRVTSAWPVREGRPCYEVVFSDGSVITADADHLWLAETYRSRWSERNSRVYSKNPGSPFSRSQTHRRSWPEVLTTAQMAASVRTAADRRLNYSIRVAKPLQGRPARLPVPPYVLGAWLGDGTSAKGEITSLDPEIIAEIEAGGETCRLVTCPSAVGKCPTYRIAGLVPRLRALGVFRDKHIPVAYLRAPEEQRRALLAGLLDTDGYCQGVTRDRAAGTVYFAVTSERLARDVRHLISTLGYKSSLNVKPVRLYGRDLGLQWVVTFTPADKVFRLQRKLERQVTAVRISSGRRFVTGIRPVPSVPVRCVTVDSPGSLYLVGETCIPTHNTAAVRELNCAIALDPLCEQWVHELKGSGDLDAFEKICHRFVSGVDDASIGYALESLRMLRKEVEKRTARMKGLPRELCPEKRVTRQIAAMRHLRLWPLACTIDECQNLYGHKEYGKEAGELAEFIIRTGPAFGVFLIEATQRPDKGSLPTGISGNVSTRFCLKVMGQVENDMILGTSAYKNGINATTFRPEIDAGIGYLLGAGPAPRVVRTFFLDVPASEKVVARARALREARGTLSGTAVDADTTVPRDVVRDVLAVFGDRAGLQWEELAARLATRFPERWADASAESVSAEVRSKGVRSVDIKADGKALKGCRLADVEVAADGS
jgi:LAGLIDADG-like domain